jgi:peptidyl-tRNA hydrolase
MYILVRESVPLGLAVTSVAHASLACYLKFRESPEMDEWLSGPFYKAVCAVSDEEFECAKQCEDHVVMSESALGGQEVSIAFKPRLDWPKRFQFFRLYREKH